MNNEVLTYTEARQALGLRNVRTVTDLVEKLRLTPKPCSRNGNAKGLDSDDMAILHEALTPRPKSRRREHAAASA